MLDKQPSYIQTKMCSSLMVIMSPPSQDMGCGVGGGGWRERGGGEHIVFGADLVGIGISIDVGVGVTLSCLHNIL